MRVAFVSPFVIQGGAERYLSLLLDGLERDWIARIYFLADGPLVGELHERGYPLEVVPTGPGPLAILRSALLLRRELRRLRPDVVHADGIKGALVTTLALAGTRVPVVWLKCDFSHDGWLARAVARRCRSIAAVSRAVTETFRDGALEKTTVVPFGLPEAAVDRERGRAAVRGLVGEGSGPVLGLVGRLDPHKGHREVLAVLPRLRERHDVRAVFVGADDPAHPGYREQLAAEIAAAGLEGAVALPGFRGDAVELIAGCDALVIPSVTSRGGLGKEGFSLVALEGMGVGTPVVAYDHGGPPEVLGDCGLLVPPGDREALGDALLRLLEDGDLRERLAQCGRRRARERFSLSAMIEAMESRYREALAAVR
ncbi:MAG TPA: glycosyltransferase family 4 protein [Gaiellaceae bacterium]|nr:glycosyltransferase family 4 protein [Gaiellaceae bacterium]